MKKYQYITIIAVLFLIYLNSATAQFSIQTGNNWYTGASNVDRLSIGTAASFPSVLFVDGANTFNSNTGEVFRTNAPNSTATYWRMFRNVSGTPTEFGTIYNNNDNNLFIEAPNANGDIRLQSGGANTRMVIEDDGDVGIGPGFLNPVSRLHLHNGGTSDIDFQMTNATTGNSSANGFKIINFYSSKNVELNQQENADMLFKTNGTQRMVIEAGGDVGIATTPTDARLHAYKSVSTSANEYGGRIDLINTNGPGQSNINSGLKVTTAITNSIYNQGVRSEVNGGSYCSGFYSGVNNSNASAVRNYGYNAEITDNGSSSGTTNTGFYNVNPANATYATNNIGFESQIGAGSTFISPGNMTGVLISNYNSSATNIGVDVHCVKSNDNYSTGTWYGVKATSTYDYPATTGVTDNYGGYFSAFGGTSHNYGIYSTGGTNCSGTPPTISTCTNAAGFFSGAVGVTGNVYSASDGFLKNNIQPLNNATAILGQLNPKTYTFKTQDYPSVHLREGNNYGLIAQDVIQVLPELVRTLSEPEVKDDQGNIVNPAVDFLGIDYTSFIPILVAGFQEQQAQIAALQTQIDNCCAAPRQGFNAPNSGSIELEDMATLQLLQNDPNPFSESTMIRWNIAGDFANAVLYFYDNKGSQINSYKVNASGAGELQIFGSRLSQGTYSYSLVVDGKMVDSKKMVKTN